MSNRAILNSKNYMNIKTVITLIILIVAPIITIGSNPDSLDIKIGQMIMIGINDRTEIKKSDELLEEIKMKRAGGIILFEKNISTADSRLRLKKLISDLKSASDIPLIVSIDEEGGKVHRLKEKYGFVAMPSASYLGERDNADTTLFYNRQLAWQLAQLGINFNYAPTVDLALNPENQVIVQKGRSFSSKHSVVTKHALLCIRAHHESGVKTILKHFPGHGSSTGDSHLGIVDVTASWTFEELYPYYEIIKSGACDAIMSAHIINKRWDTLALPATLSEKVINGMLRGMLGYNGVVFSDDMQMYAISKNYGFERSLELAINAGIDILMFGNNVSKEVTPVTATEIHKVIKKLVREGKVSEQRIDQAYRRIMKLKTGLI